MKPTLLLALVFCTGCGSPSAPSLVSGSALPVSSTFVNRSTVSPFAELRGTDAQTFSTLVAVSEVGVSRAPLRVYFVGNWVGPLPCDQQPCSAFGLTIHELTRPGLPPSANTAQEVEAFINQTWLPQELRALDGSITGFGCIDILNFSPTDFNSRFILSDSPIAYVNNTCSP